MNVIGHINIGYADTDSYLSRAGYGEVFVAQPYGDKWRKQRKLVSQHFGQAIISQYSQVQEMETRKLIYSLVQDPSSLVHQARL